MYSNIQYHTLRVTNNELMKTNGELTRANVYYHEELNKSIEEMQRKNVEMEQLKKELVSVSKNAKKIETELATSKNKIEKLEREVRYYKKQTEELSKQQSQSREVPTQKVLDLERLVEFLYSGVTSKESLKLRHKRLQVLFHPDNFKNGETVFKALQHYYESASKRYK